MNTPSVSDINEKAKNIRLLLLDVDGVLTDGKLYYGNDGNEIKAFHTLDGHGIKLLQRSGVEVGIVTGRTSDLVAKRANELNIQTLVQGREDKLAAVNDIIKAKQLDMSALAFMGDDYPDLTVMNQAGLSMTVANALPAMAANAHWQSTRKGGEGAVREACDMIMQAQGTYVDALKQYLL